MTYAGRESARGTVPPVAAACSPAAGDKKEPDEVTPEPTMPASVSMMWDALRPEGRWESMSPVPFLRRRSRYDGRSSRLRHRHGRRDLIRARGNQLIAAFNGLDRGQVDGQTRLRGRCEVGPCTEAVASVHDMVLREVSRLERDRRGALPSGGPALARIMKVPHYDAYHSSSRNTPHVSIIASALAEPSTEACVEMLEETPIEERGFPKKPFLSRKR